MLKEKGKQTANRKHGFLLKYFKILFLIHWLTIVMNRQMEFPEISRNHEVRVFRYVKLSNIVNFQYSWPVGFSVEYILFEFIEIFSAPINNTHFLL